MRGHAKGPFNPQGGDPLPVLRVQKQWQITPGGSFQMYVEAAIDQPVLLKFIVNTRIATTNGTNTLNIGNTSSATAYFNGSADSNPGSTGFAAEKKFELIASMTLIASFLSAAISATGVLTITATTSADTQTVVIGGQTYTFNTSLTNTANNVLIGASATTMAANLASAINAGAGSGTTYGAGTVANTNVTATSNLGVLTVTAKVPGTGANSVATTETLSNGSWANATLTGGDTASPVGAMDIFIDA